MRSPCRLFLFAFQQGNKVRVLCTADTLSTRTQKGGRSCRASAEKSTRRQTAPRLSWNKSRQQLTCVCVIKQAEDCKSGNARAFIRCSRGGLQTPIKEQRNKATYTATRWGAFGCPWTRDNHKQPTELLSRVQIVTLILLFLFYYCSYYTIILYSIHSK